MALEEAVARGVGKGSAPSTVRFWRSASSVVVGRFQSVEAEVDLEFCAERGIAVVRRFTGGGAVYHDLGNLNYAVSTEKGERTIEDFRRASAKLPLAAIEGLKKLGLNPEFRGANAILVDGRKVSGIAGALKWNAIFHHGCLLVSADLNALRRALRRFRGDYKPVERSVSSVKMEIANLSEFKELRIEDVKEALRRGIEEVYGAELTEGELTRWELRKAKELYRNKYLRPEWNLRGETAYH